MVIWRGRTTSDRQWPHFGLRWLVCARAPFHLPNASPEIPIVSFTAERKAAIENNQEVGMRAGAGTAAKTA